MKNIAIIPARSGSKGLKDKNIKLLNGKPLMAYTIEAALESNMFDIVMVSTDSQEYARIAEEYGADVPFLRSKAMSSDEAGSWDVVKEVLKKYRELGMLFDTVCLLQPTSPLRTSDNIINAYKLLEQKQAEAITSVCEVDHSPLWCNTLPVDKNMQDFIKKDIKNLGRQKLDRYFRINGAIYIRKINYNDKINIKEELQYAYVMDKEISIDIDDILDFKVAQVILAEFKQKRK